MGRLGEPHVGNFPRNWRKAPLGTLLLYFLYFLAFLAHSPAELAGQARAYGPLTWEESSPVHRLASTPAFETADLIPAAELSVDVWLGWSNVFEQDSSATHVVFLDTERLLSAVTVRWGAAPRLEVGGRITVETTGGGILDEVVYEYHEALSFGQANRDRFPQDEYAQRVTDGDATRYVDLRRRTLDLADAQLFAKWGAYTGSDGTSTLSVRASVRIPTRANRVAPERADGALVAFGHFGGGPWYLHTMAGAVAVRAAPELNPVLRDASAFFGVAIERSLGRSVAAIVQYQLSTPMLRGFGHRELDWPSSNLVVGAAGRWGDAWSWDASFQEDLPADTPAIDFTLGLRVSRRWRQRSTSHPRRRATLASRLSGRTATARPKHSWNETSEP
jgi:hypothetical protein